MITIVGLGPGSADALPARTRFLLFSGVSVYLRTLRHPTLETDLPPGAIGLDDEYENNPSFDDTYNAIVARLLRAHGTSGDLIYAVPGHPLVGETTVARLLSLARARNIPIRVWGAPSFVDACLELLGEAITTDLHVLDALALPPDDPSHPALLAADSPILLYQVHNQEASSQVKLSLMRAGYPDDFTVTILHAAGVPGEERRLSCPLYALDRATTHAHDHLTSVWVPPLPASLRRPAYADLVRVMARLRRRPDGCPWDLKQTHQTLRRYLLEEAYEVAEAIDRIDNVDTASDGHDALCEELGDLLLQVVFHAQIAAESGIFDERDVCGAIVDKLIRRHPHIFGDVKVSGADEVLTNWQAIKSREKGYEARVSVLDGISTSLPALMLAMETSRRAVNVGFEWPDGESLWAKVQEELAELRAEIGNGTAQRLSETSQRVFEEFGDVLFTLVNVARWLQIDPEQALRAQVARFGERFRYMEAQVVGQGRGLAELSPDELQSLWQQAKAKQREASSPADYGTDGKAMP